MLFFQFYFQELSFLVMCIQTATEQHILKGSEFTNLQSIWAEASMKDTTLKNVGCF